MSPPPPAQVATSGPAFTFVDGHAYHSTRQATTRDRRKDNDLELAGYRVTRFTADQILHDPSDTLARTKKTLAQ